MKQDSFLKWLKVISLSLAGAMILLHIFSQNSPGLFLVILSCILCVYIFLLPADFFQKKKAQDIGAMKEQQGLPWRRIILNMVYSTAILSAVMLAFNLFSKASSGWGTSAVIIAASIPVLLVCEILRYKKR